MCIHFHIGSLVHQETMNDDSNLCVQIVLQKLDQVCWPQRMLLQVLALARPYTYCCLQSPGPGSGSPWNFTETPRQFE